MATVHQIAAYLDGLLKVAEFQDSSHNGLQVENSGQAGTICCGVDASLEFFEQAKRRRAGLLIVHHGLSWNDSLKRITGLNHQRLSFLIRNDMALYACHLPLDAHPRYGNNIGMARALGLRKLRRFGFYHGKYLSFRGELPEPMTLDRFAARVSKVVGNEAQVMPFGKRRVKSVAFVVGGGMVGMDDAARLGIDVYLSGEPGLVAYNTARDWKMNAVFGGHYATESFGVQSLAALLVKKFRVKAEFLPLGVRF